MDHRLENDIVDWGYKFHMNDINATIGLSNLKFIKKITLKNRKNSKFLFYNLKNNKKIKCLNPISKKFNSSYWLFTILINKRNKFIKFMRENNIFVSQVHRRNDAHTCFKKFKKNLKNLDKIEKKLICIPCGWWLKHKDLTLIVKKINEFTRSI